LRGKVEGQAEVAFTIQPDGSVRNVQLLSSSPADMFDNAAIAAASRWRFEATGQTHASRRTVLFRLPD
jgi:protein TonB